MARKNFRLLCLLLFTVVNALHCISWDGRMEHLLFYLRKQSPVLALYNDFSLSTSDARRSDVVQHLRSTRMTSSLSSRNHFESPKLPNDIDKQYSQ
jgi:hypothetical protein